MHTTILLGALIAFDAIMLILVLFLLSKYTKVKRSYDFFMRGKDAESMEDMIFDLEESLRQLQAEDQINKEAIQRASYQKVGIVRYNAFKDMGGKMSFALALLDYTNSGFIMTTVHSREGCYLYIKTVDCGQTEVLLGAEEKDALERALGYTEA